MNDIKSLVKYNVFLTTCFSVNKKAALVVSKVMNKLYNNMSFYCFGYNVILFESLFVCLQVDIFLLSKNQ
jgi:hypothetical protein